MALDLQHDANVVMACSPTAEDVVIRRPGEVQRTITVVVDRNIPIVPSDAPGPTRATSNMTVSVVNDAVTGIDAATFTKPYGTMDVAIREGCDETVARTINKVLSQDAGSLLLEVI